MTNACILETMKTGHQVATLNTPIVFNACICQMTQCGIYCTRDVPYAHLFERLRSPTVNETIVNILDPQHRLNKPRKRSAHQFA